MKLNYLIIYVLIFEFFLLLHCMYVYQMNKLGINSDCCGLKKEVYHQINRQLWYQILPQFWEKGAKISFKF